jgi:hypothetical protein
MKNKGEPMTTKIGLWIDHLKASILAIITKKGREGDSVSRCRKAASAIG